MQSIHEPVLLHEVVEYFAPRASISEPRASITPTASISAPTPWYIDGTLGGAGHALALAKVFNGQINIIGLDNDEQAINRAQKTLADKCQRLILQNENYRNLDKVVEQNNLKGVDLILLDLGISSDELDNSGRGFTFRKDEPLLMTMGDPAKYQFTAKDIVNNWDEEVIADIIFGYGEEKFARRIAKTIINYRQKKKIETSGELAELIKMSVPDFYKRGKIDPATKTFQALRIAVNDELNALKQGLKKGYDILNNGGRMAVISFHSLEDRIVKDFYKEKMKEGAKILTKKPITACDQEIAENPRSRSAKLRVIEKVI